jgi:IS1 family transposase
MCLSAPSVRDAAQRYFPGVTVSIGRVEAAEVDEMWIFVGSKREPRWLWHAIDHWSGAVLAYVFGRRQDEVFLKLKALLEPFGITRFFMDHWGGVRTASGSRNPCPWETHYAAN